ncbi:hypothetical protein SHANETTE_75 [Bacillus phage Shanette]|uniref:Uncharacterized protein n=1 Tax=Bacillus phage Shanette TaxID=1296656 RepID=S5MB39_9CAUD|nr:hypothetical protein AVV46_gp220 [Bacillus phage Shanette]AGR46974.2 hypothetical protein SHANETTE_75 [Bacillus phage Shanette]
MVDALVSWGHTVRMKGFRAYILNEHMFVVFLTILFVFVSIVLLKVCIVWKAYIHPIVGVESPLSSLPHISKVRIP